ncbi:MAG: magnesium transporter MgtC [Citrobacter freundii]|nr:MAG: magnesium transporter MgtC [Citrobacter freundii]
MVLTSQEIFLRLLLSLLWGGLIGLERQYHHKPAGFRTMIMISIGSCLFSILSLLPNNAEAGNRIAANVVTGIGFLGAGVIFRSSNRVNGITTAAAIWSVAAIGMSIGTGFYFIASMGSLLILSVLAALPLVEQLMERRHLYREYHMVFEGSAGQKKYCTDLLGKHQLRSNIIRESWSSELIITLEAWGRPLDHEAFVEEITHYTFLKKIDFVS